MSKIEARPFSAAYGTRQQDANNVMNKIWPVPVAPPRIVLPAPAGQLPRLKVQIFIQYFLDELDADSVGNVTDAAGDCGTAAVDTFIMHLAHTGANWQAAATAGNMQWNDTQPAVIETPYSVFYARMQDQGFTPLQFLRSVAKRASDLADEFQVVYQWGANRGVQYNDRRLSHAAADRLASLSSRDHELIATVSAAALKASAAQTTLNMTTEHLLMEAPPAPNDPLAVIQNRIALMRGQNQ